MENFKRYITIVVAVFMGLGTPLLAHAITPSDNSVTVFPAEGNGNCNDYAENGVIMAISASAPGSGTATDGTESVHYTFNTSRTELSFDSASIPIDFLTIKAKRSIGVFIYASGGIDNDSGITLDGTKFSSVEFCYGLGNEPVPPVNTAPELAEITDQSGLVDEVIAFSVSATDDGLPVSPGSLSISVDTLGANFTDNGDGTGDFSWTATSGGITDITFTVDDGELTDSQTVAITVQEPLQTASCAFITDPGDGDTLDETGVVCPADGSRALVCNLQLDEEFFGLELEDHCCICNQDGLGSVTPLDQCDPSIPAGGAPVNGIGSCLVEGAVETGLEVSTHLEFNNDPYYCRTVGGRRTCYRY